MDLRRITLDDGTQITATGSHPFWNPNSFQWQPLEDFGIGDTLASRQGLREITHIELLPEGATVYNIEVASEHVYEVGQCGVLVHNSGGFNCQRYLELMNKKSAGTLSQVERLEYIKLQRLLRNEEVHHIATHYGKWGDKFKALFAPAGLDIHSALNKIAIKGHSGRYCQMLCLGIFD